MTVSMIENWRVALIVSVLFSVMVLLGGQFTGGVYPGMLVPFAAGMTVLLLIGLKGGSSSAVIFGGMLLALTFRVHTNYVTTPAGDSPQGAPGQMNNILETGEILLRSPFYQEAPIHFLLGTMASGVLGVDAYDGIMIYGLLITIILTLISIGLLRLLGVRDGRALAAVVILALVTTEGLRRSYWVVPQVTGALLFWCVVFAITKYVSKPSSMIFIPVALFATVLAITHKLPLVILSGILFFVILMSYSDQIVFSDIDRRATKIRFGSLFIFVSLIAGAQLLFVGGLFGNVITRIERFIGSYLGADFDSVSGGGPSDPQGAVEALPGIIAYFYEYPSSLSLFVERGHGVWLLLAAGTAWVLLYLYNRDTRERPILLFLHSTSAIGVIMIFIGVVSIDAINPTRPLVLIEPILIVIIVRAAWVWRDRFSWYKIGSGLVLLLLISSQVFAGSAAPDYANTPQYYAEVPEAQAETTMCQYAQGDIHVDEQYSRFTGIDYNSCSEFTSFGRDDKNPLFTQSFEETDAQMMAYRKDVDVYLGRFDRWRLTWEPEETIPQQNHVVFDNGAVEFYHEPNGISI